MYKDFIDAFAEKATLQRVQNPEPATRALSENPHAVLITDAALTGRKDIAVWRAVLRYVRNGGTAICMGSFPSFFTPPNFNAFFAEAGLSWEMGSYHRTTVHINRDNVQPGIQSVIPVSYSQKAVFMKGVDSADACYHPGDDSVVESMVFPPTRVDTSVAPVALTEVGRGKLGYVGDVNTEVGTKLVVLAMCGLQ